MIRIQRVTESTLEKVLPLIRKYQAFYGTSPAGSANRRFFRRLVRDSSRGALFLALGDKKEALGFATLYFLPSSLSAQTACVLNDLYTVAARRRQGVAGALLRSCAEHALKKGLRKIEWQTQVSNKTAQRFYEKTHASKTSWIHYAMTLK